MQISVYVKAFKLALKLIICMIDRIYSEDFFGN